MVVVPIRSERNSNEKGVFHIRAAKYGARAKKWKEGGGGGERGTLARQPLDFEKRPLVFTVELIY